MSPAMRHPRRAMALAFALATAAGPAAAQSHDSVASLLARVRAELPARVLPDAKGVTEGTRLVPAGTTVAGDVATHGPLEVRGEVGGHAYALGGDLTVGAGGHVKGDAIAVGGSVQLDGGTVDGEIRQVSTAPLAAADTGVLPAAGRSPFAQALGWLVVLLLIGFGTLVFADRYLDGVVRELERGVPRAFLIGLAGELALAPALGLICVGLVLTLLGILLIPFAVVAFVLAATGLFTLGYLGVASLVGSVLVRGGNRLSARGAALRALLTGLLVLMAFWLVAGLMGFNGMALLVARGIAVAVTWVAATAGFGAAIASRGGALRRRPAAITSARTGGDLSWQTPTPVRGVAAARRATTAAGRERR
ncbi:MAG: polymer-forming cytoskeletal protein [Gemmatimonadetes bacterium]|nr:polymer-forming cytoskeletal protein [Gemmatimonadota bacterium]